ncbi:MAG: TolC family protein, partial [Methylotenera sp.]
MTICKAALLTCLPVALVACGFQQYVAKPIDASAVAHKIDNRRPDDSQFHQFLISNGYSPDQLPIQQWGLDELIYCALFFHPSLDVARAQWRAAEAAKLTAAEKPKPTIKGSVANSNNANNDISPYALGLSIDIPIETADKRSIRIENAEHLSLAARLKIAQTAWQLRNQVAQSLYEYQFNQQQIKLLTVEQSQRQNIVA